MQAQSLRDGLAVQCSGVQQFAGFATVEAQPAVRVQEKPALFQDYGVQKRLRQTHSRSRSSRRLAVGHTGASCVHWCLHQLATHWGLRCRGGKRKRNRHTLGARLRLRVVALGFAKSQPHWICLQVWKSNHPHAALGARLRLRAATLTFVEIASALQAALGARLRLRVATASSAMPATIAAQ